MKKNTKKVKMGKNDLAPANHQTTQIEIFKSRVANAVLDYMEGQNDLELIDCLEKASIFLNHISLQMENAFDNQKQRYKDQNELFDIGEDLFSTNKQVTSSTIH